ncbi:MAG TPA: Zn-ribbon domain-containing protein [Methanoregulaceae archaeon]|nr:Zn-ribbon domain-containing protein [Methanoregulaceae archaeon]HPD74445.1 Zn-ribbon domain-containing protein [Methanoregulaceae archaeon]HRY74765.1 Zn-ribbon domain-containing protein [Methanoregulaceae archaeon]
MPHKCTRCGREYEDGSTEILRGCGSCGGKKFLYVRQEEIHRDMIEEKSAEEIVTGKEEEILEVKTEPDKGVEMYDRVETIRIVGPGTYELNLEKMAEGDERIISVGKEGVYNIDLLSFSKDEKKKKRKKR